VIVSRTKASDALFLLSLWNIDQPPIELDDHTVDTINDWYKRAARRTHPDIGGSAEEFAAVDRAKHVLLKWLERQAAAPPPPHGGVSECPRCHGERHVYLWKGVRKLRVQCPTCKGNGEIYDEREKENDRL
jgi:DnaJ-class molecular chaperone